MATKQSVVQFSVRKTRSSLKAKTFDSKSSDNKNDANSRRLSRRRTAVCTEPVDPIKSPCSPSKRQKEELFPENRLPTTPELSTKLDKVEFCTPKKQNQKNKENDNHTPSPNSLENSPLKSGDINVRDTTRKLIPISLFRQDVSVYQEVKKALSSSETTNLCCRETEIKGITTFLTNHLNNKESGSLYISGAPGTGKTACLNQILQAVKFQQTHFKCIYINCTNLISPSSIFERIYSQMEPKCQLFKNMKISDIQDLVQNKIVNSKNTIVLVLDEIDFLESHSQSILYTIFEWPALATSGLLLIGIANALDLMDRVLPRLRVLPDCKPTLLHFKTYTKDQIVAILQDRLSQISGNAAEIIKPAALQFCARKVASMSGDIRKALDLCRRAVEKVETEARKQQILKPRTCSEGSYPQTTLKESPGKMKTTKSVELSTIVSILDDVYGDKLTKGGSQHNESSLPVQQKVILCSLILIIKNKKCQEVMLGKFHEVYSRVCQIHRVVQHVDLSEFLNLCNLLDVRGLISVKKNKDVRLAKVRNYHLKYHILPNLVALLIGQAWR